jgi:archaeosine synthase
MNNFFEVLSSQIGFSRIGRILFSKERKLYISTPNILIPIKNALMQQLNFIQEFEEHELFTVSKEIFLKIGFIKEKFKNTGFFYSHTGTLQKFQEILKNNLLVFSGDNIISILPFNVPSTALSREFAISEINNHLLRVKELLHTYSDLNFGLSIKTFNYSELINLYIPLIKENSNIKILNLADLFDNPSNFRTIIKTILKIKKELDNNLILMVSGRITTKSFPILVYMGIDLIDSSYLMYLSSKSFYDTIDYFLPAYKIKYLPCSCIACTGKLKNLLDNDYSPEKIDLLCLHNLITANNFIKKIKQYLTYEDYRVFVEYSSFTDLNLISMLKILDKDYFNLIRYETPITQKIKKIKCLGPSSYYRPDFREFRKRIVKNFEPEPWTTLIILIPCSAKKPYSESKSHRKFHKIMRNFPEFPKFQEMIITSPLGVIPRQLENVYPANSYDISVTGDWDNEEINISAEMLVRMLEKYDKEIPIICHLTGEYLEIIKRASTKLNHKFIFVKIQDKNTSEESLSSLKKEITKFKDYYVPTQEIKNISHLSKSWFRKFSKILDYQFNIGLGSKLISNERLKLNRNKSTEKINLIDLKTKQKLAVFNSSTGQIDLKLASLQRMAHSNFSIENNYIVFNGEKIQGSTLFRAGVLDYSEDLLPRNQVFIFNKAKNDIIALGRLIVGSKFLKNSQTGRIAEILEKNKKIRL